MRPPHGKPGARAPTETNLPSIGQVRSLPGPTLGETTAEYSPAHSAGLRAQVWGCDDKPMSHEMFQYLPWPFPDNQFPADLGAVVMRSVLDGVMPALQVLHDPEGG